VELGEFLRSRRRRVDSGDVGFPSTDRRRAPGLRREELSAMAGVAVSWLAKLEQGKAHAVSPDVLDALAHALRLDPAERAHLLGLGGFRVHAGDLPAPRVTPALRSPCSTRPAPSWWCTPRCRVTERPDGDPTRVLARPRAGTEGDRASASTSFVRFAHSIRSS